MSVVLQHDKRSNITYAYHNEIIREGEKKKNKRTLIGRVNPETGEIERTRGSRRQYELDESVMDEDIRAYNRKARAERAGGRTDDDNLQDLAELRRSVEKLSSKFEEMKGIMLSLSESINSVFKE